MKWIKTFEELTPDTYRKAGQNLMWIPHKVDRGRKLKDYGSEKEWGVFNMDLVKNYGEGVRDKRFTRPTAKFNLNIKMSADHPLNTTYEKITVEELIDLWKEGERELYFTIDFYFEPLEETKKSIVSFPEMCIFSFKVNLSTWDDSLETYNDPGEYDDEDMDLFKKYTIEELYQETSDVRITLEKPNVDSRRNQIYYYGIFSDRNSAFKFKRLMPSLINDGIVEKIWEVFSLLGDSKNFQKCIHALKHGIRVNNLYDDAKVLSPSNFKNPTNWYGYILANIVDVPKKEEIKEDPVIEEPKEEEIKEDPKQTWYQSRT